MALQFSDIFDFAGYTQAIKDAGTANREFAKNVIDLNKQIEASFENIKSELKDYAAILKNFSVTTSGAGARLREIGDESDRLTTRLKTQKEAIMVLNQVQDITTLSTDELKTAATGLRKEYNSLRGDTEDLRIKKVALAGQLSQVTTALKLQTAATRETAKEVKYAADTYKAWEAEMKDIKTALLNMVGAFDPLTGKINQNNTAAVAMRDRYLQLNTTLKNIDAGMGNFQRSVGNYEKGFSGLGNSINQITREFPAFANSVQTGFLALSNNIPIFFDQMKETNVQLKALRAEGKQVPSLLSALGSSFFTFGTVLSFGVTLLTVYGKDIVEFIGKLFKGKDSLDKISVAFQESAQSTRIFTEALASPHVKSAIENVTELGKEIQLAKDGFISKEGVVKHYNETIGKTTGLVKSVDEAEQQLVKNGEAYIRFTILKTAAQQAFNESAAKEIERQKAIAQGLTQSANGTDRDLEAKISERLKKSNEYKDILKQADKEFAAFGKITDATRKRQTEFEQQVREGVLSPAQLNQDINGLEQIGKKLLDQAADISKKFKFNFFGDTKEDKKAENKALNDYEKALREREAVLKKQFEEEVILAQGKRDRDEISEVEFQDAKYQAAVKYAKAATAEEVAVNKVGYKAKKSLLDEFDNVRLKAEEDFNSSIEKEGTEHDKRVLAARMKALEDLAAIETAGTKEQQELALSNQRLTNAERVRLEIEYQNKLDEIQIESLRARSELELDQDKKRLLKAQAAGLQTGIDRRNRFADNVAIPRAQAQDNFLDINKELNRRRTLGILTVQYEIEATERIMQIRKKLNLNTDAEEAKLLELRKKRQDDFVSYLKSSSQIVGGVLGEEFGSLFDDVINGFQKLANGGKLAYEDYANFAMDTANAVTANYKANLDQQISDLEMQKDAELKAVGNNQAAQDAINKKYAKEEAMLKRKQAKADRDNAVFQILVNTSEAVVKAIAASPLTFGLPWSAAAAAIGALQVALVLSRPLPQFEKGTEYSPEGLAVVGEKGSEMVVDPSGKLRIVGEKGPELTYLKKGSKVKTAQKTKQIMERAESEAIMREMNMGSMLSGNLRINRQDETANAMSRALQHSGLSAGIMGELFQDAVSKIPVQMNYFDERGYTRAVKRGNSTTKYLNDNFKLSR